MSLKAWAQLKKDVVACEVCPRLVEHCQKVAIEKRRAYRNENYWGKPVPNLGKPKSSLLIVGLAPGAHGANRTGRMFTGDRSGDWLFAALHRSGFANQAESTGRRDGLKLINAAITNVGRCAPPGNKPTREELECCKPFFHQTIELVNPKVIIPLGGIAWRETLRALEEIGQFQPSPKPKFTHGVEVAYEYEDAKGKSQNRFLIGCYHPSQQNTFTGRLTKPMINRVFAKAKKLCG